MPLECPECHGHLLLKLPLYLDSIGIVVAAIFLGVWWGALVGILTALIGTFIICSGSTTVGVGLANGGRFGLTLSRGNY